MPVGMKICVMVQLSPIHGFLHFCGEVFRGLYRGGGSKIVFLDNLSST